MTTVIVTDVDVVESGHGAWRRALGSADVPLVLWSSRTFSEVTRAQRRLGLDDAPFFVENGSALFLPRSVPRAMAMLAFDVGSHYLMEFGCARAYAAGIVDGIAHACGLIVARTAPSQPAEGRCYDDAIAGVAVPPAQRLRAGRVLRRAGLAWTMSAQGYHVNGVLDHGVGLGFVRWLYEQRFDDAVTTVGIGTTLNHGAVLREVDVPVVVAGSDARTMRRLARARVDAITIDPSALPMLIQHLTTRPSPGSLTH